MSNLIEHARTELQLAGLFDEDSDYGGMLGNAVMELMEVFVKQRHSGASAALTISVFKTVAGFKPLIPLTGKNEEWIDIAEEEGETLYQNKRLSSVFKKGKKGRPYYLDAIVFQIENGESFSGTVENVESRQYIKSFPFIPKTFYIDVISSGDDYVIKDKTQLSEVWRYYKKVRDGENQTKESECTRGKI